MDIRYFRRTEKSNPKTQTKNQGESKSNFTNYTKCWIDDKNFLEKSTGLSSRYRSWCLSLSRRQLVSSSLDQMSSRQKMGSVTIKKCGCILSRKSARKSGSKMCKSQNGKHTRNAQKKQTQNKLKHTRQGSQSWRSDGCHHWHTGDWVAVAADLWPWTWKVSKVKNNWFRKETAATGLCHSLDLFSEQLVFWLADRFWLWFGCRNRWRKAAFPIGEIPVLNLSSSAASHCHCSANPPLDIPQKRRWYVDDSFVSAAAGQKEVEKSEPSHRTLVLLVLRLVLTLLLILFLLLSQLPWQFAYTIYL